MALHWHDSIMILTDAVLFVFFFVSFRGTRVLIPLETKTLSFSNFILKKLLSLLDPRKWKFLFLNSSVLPTIFWSPHTCTADLLSLLLPKWIMESRKVTCPPPPTPRTPLQFCPEWEVSIHVDLREGWVISYPKTSIDPFSVCGFKWKLPFSTFRWYFFVLYMVVLTFQSVSKKTHCVTIQMKATR